MPSKPSQQWDESRVKRGKNGRFAKSSGGDSVVDRFNAMRAEVARRGREGAGAQAHHAIADRIHSMNNAQAAAGIAQSQQSYMKITAAGNAPLRSAGGQAHLKRDAAMRKANNARSNTPAGRAVKAGHAVRNEAGNARGRAAIERTRGTGSTRPGTASTPKSSVQRQYDAAARRFKAKTQRQGQ